MTNVDERRLGRLRWLVVTGERVDAFRCLGEHMREEVQLALLMPQIYQLRRFTADPPGSDRLLAVRKATMSAFPEEWAELAAMADGASVSLDDLALLHFRGDLGDTTTTKVNDDIGCSDIAWRGKRSFFAHNEDAFEYYDGHCAFLTLDLDGELRSTAFWYPGMLPSNAFNITETGLAWSIDHLQAAKPGSGAGRHFVSRGLQRRAANVEQAIRYLHDQQSAGGFAYTIGDRTGRIVMIETSAGQFACNEVGPSGPLAWHTNHGRYVSDAEPNATGSSLQRAAVLQALDDPVGEPDYGWFIRVLMGAAPPGGVREDPSEANRSLTLCTFVVSLSDGDAIVLWRDGEPVHIPTKPPDACWGIR